MKGNRAVKKGNDATWPTTIRNARHVKSPHQLCDPSARRRRLLSSGDRKFPTRMKVVVIYDSPEHAGAAIRALRRAAQSANSPSLMDIRPWRLEILRLLPAVDLALTEATDASLIILAGHRSRSLPTWLRSWLERWAERHVAPEAALALSGDGELPTPDIREFAERHGLSLIARGAALEQHHTTERWTPPALAPFMEPSSPTTHRSWGINE